MRQGGRLSCSRGVVPTALLTDVFEMPVQGVSFRALALGGSAVWEDVASQRVCVATQDGRARGSLDRAEFVSPRRAEDAIRGLIDGMWEDWVSAFTSGERWTAAAPLLTNRS